jgi:hypothetical protein
MVVFWNEAMNGFITSTASTPETAARATMKDCKSLMMNIFNVDVAEHLEKAQCGAMLGRWFQTTTADVDDT